MRTGTRPANLMLLALASLVAGGLAELLLRYAAPQPLDAAYVWTDGTLRHLPSFRFTYTRQGFSNTVSYNALGLRGREVAARKDPGTLRILFLGDSFVEGKQVGDDEVITAVLERLGAQQGLRLEVVNAGVGGYGTGDELLLWQEIGAMLRPDLVLVGFFPNDIRNAVDRAFFDVKDGRVVQVAEPPQPRIRWLYEMQKFLVARSHLCYLVKDALLRLRGQAPGQPREVVAGAGTIALQEDEDVLAREPSPQVARGWALTLAMLGELGRRVEAQGARVAVVAFPNRYQVDEALWQAHAQRLGLDPTSFDLWLPQRRLEEWAVANGAVCIDLLPVFRAAGNAEGFYHAFDAHWNAAGHRQAASALLGELNARGLLARPSGLEEARQDALERQGQLQHASAIGLVQAAQQAQRQQVDSGTQHR